MDNPELSHSNSRKNTEDYLREIFSSKPTREKSIVFFLITAILLIVSYYPALNGRYLADDVALVAENPLLDSFSNIPRMLVSAFKPIQIYPEEGILVDPGYRPVTGISFMIDYQVAGRNVFFHHTVNVLIHFLSGILLYILFRKLTGNFWAAAIASSIWILHPLASEAVAPIHSRKEVLSFFLTISSLLLSLKFRVNRKPLTAIAAIIIYILALYSKESAVVLPALVLAAWIYLDREKPLADRAGNPGKFLSIQYKSLLAPLFVVGLIFGLIVIFVKNPSTRGSEFPWWGGSISTSFLSMSRALTHYIGLFLYPGKLTIDYSYNAFEVSRGILKPATTLPAVLFVAALVAVSVYAFIKNFKAGLFLAFLWVALAPVLQIVPQVERVAERFMYVPMIAIAGMISVLVALAWNRKLLRIPIIAVTLIILIAFTVRTNIRAGDYASAKELWKSAVEAYPDCIRARFELANELYARGETESAVDNLKELIRQEENIAYESWMTRPWRAALEAKSLLARIYMEKENYIASAEMFGMCLEMIHPQKKVKVSELDNFINIKFNLALTLEKSGNKNASRDLYAGIYQKSDLLSEDIRFETAMALYRLDNPENAIEYLDAAISADPGRPVVRAMLAKAANVTDEETREKLLLEILEVLRKNRPAKGIVLPLSPGEMGFIERDCRLNLGELYFNKKEFQKIPILLEPLRNIDQNDPKTLLLLGKTYIELGENGRATGALKAVLPKAEEYRKARELLESLE